MKREGRRRGRGAAEVGGAKNKGDGRGLAGIGQWISVGIGRLGKTRKEGGARWWLVGGSGGEIPRGTRWSGGTE